MKRIFASAIAIATTITMSAAPLSPEQALHRAFDNGPMKIPGKQLAALKLAHSVTSGNGTPAIYVFDRPASSGYVIVSADDVAAPILGYADNGSFNKEDMPPQMEWWLSEYATRIANYSSSAAYTTRATQHPAVAPLMKTVWNQGTPFNNLCPLKDGTRCPTGCVATAVAQVMKYYNYPASGKGRVTGPDGILRLDNIKFDWDNMISSYNGDYTKTQATAVATLMQAVGYASKMSYSPNGSGALSLNAAKALSQNFKYNSNIRYLQRDYFNATEWNEIVYAEIAAGRPVLYGGQSTSVGHEFVCDGYDGNGYFHFNWGWGGMSDGYFLLDALNPDSVGTGGGEGGGYNSGQDIIIGVQPETGENSPRVTQFGSLTATTSGVTLNLSASYKSNTGSWVNAGIVAINVEIAAEFAPVSGTSAPQYSSLWNGNMDALNLDGYNVSYSGIKASKSITIPSTLSDGKYKVTICSRDAGSSNSPWLPVLTTNGAYNYIYLTKSGGTYKVEELKEAELSIISATPTTDVYYQNACKIKLSVANNSELEMTGGFFPVLLSGTKEVMIGEGISLTLQPGEQVEKEFVTVFELLEGAAAPTRSMNYTLRFLKGANSEEYYNHSTLLKMNILTGTPSLKITDYCVEGAGTKEITIGNETKTAFVASNAADIPFSAQITNSGAFFGSQLYTLIFNADLSGYNISSAAMGPTPILGKEESATVKGSADFTAGEVGKAYAAGLFYASNEGLQQLKSCPIIYFTIDPSSGINDMTADGETYLYYDHASHSVIANGGITAIEIYDLNGCKLAHTSGNSTGTLTLSLEDISSGVVVAVGRSATGETRTLKILL